MKKLNQKGFGIVEVLLVILLIGLVGGIGYYVYNQAQKNDETSQPSGDTSGKIEKKAETVPVVKDETTNWLLYESPGGEFKIKLADGWSFTRYMKYPSIFQLDNKLEIKPGTRAVVEEVTGGRDFNTGLSISYSTAKELSEPWQAPQGKKQLSGTTKAGLTIDKYYLEVTEEPQGIGVPAGGKQYEYYVGNKKGRLGLIYSFGPNQTDYHKEVEKILSSIQIQ